VAAVAALYLQVMELAVQVVVELVMELVHQFRLRQPLTLAVVAVELPVALLHVALVLKREPADQA